MPFGFAYDALCRFRLFLMVYSQMFKPFSFLVSEFQNYQNILFYSILPLVFVLFLNGDLNYI